MTLARPLLVTLLSVAVLGHADEGMWTLDNFPAASVEQRYGVAIDDSWLHQVQTSFANE